MVNEQETVANVHDRVMPLGIMRFTINTIDGDLLSPEVSGDCVPDTMNTDAQKTSTKQSATDPSHSRVANRSANFVANTSASIVAYPSVRETLYLPQKSGSPVTPSSKPKIAGASVKLHENSTGKEKECPVKSESSELYVVKNCEVMVDKPRIEIQYFKEKKSLYSDVTSSWTSTSRAECALNAGREELADFGFQDVEQNNCDPLELGYFVGAIAKGDTCFIQRNDSVSYEFPSQLDPSLIIQHGPSEVWGYEDDRLVIGVVSTFHNNPAVSYQWLREGKPVDGGGTACILVVKEPGSYRCLLTLISNVGGEDGQCQVSMESDSVQVLTDMPDAMQPPDQCPTTVSVFDGVPAQAVLQTADLLNTNFAHPVQQTARVLDMNPAQSVQQPATSTPLK